jgi:signal recognition particle receptor subunit beta
MLLVLAHKYDLLKTGSSTISGANSPNQLAINRVRTVLERELEKRRQSHAGGIGMEAIGGESEESGELGGLDCTGNGGFRFSDWEGGEIAFIGTSVLDKLEKMQGTDEKVSDSEATLSNLLHWLSDLP